MYREERRTARHLARRSGFGACMLLLALVFSSDVAVAGAQQYSPQQQYPVFTAIQLDTAMKTAGAALTLAKRAAAKSATDDAKDYLIRVREQVATTVAFWRNARDDNAVKMLRASLDAMDHLDDALSTMPVDQVLVTQRTTQVEATCTACHQVHREFDPLTKTYRLRSAPTR